MTTMEEMLHNSTSLLDNTTGALTTTTVTCLTYFRPPETLGWYEKFRITVEVFIVGVLCVLGFVGNALCVVVLYRDNDNKNATNWLLRTLAIFDTLYLITCLFIFSLQCIHDYTYWIPALSYAWPYLKPSMWALSSIAQTMTVWMVLLVTIDRYVAICRPLDTQLRSVERAKIATVVITCLAIVYNIPRFLERQTHVLTDPCTNTTVAISNKTALREDEVYLLVYKTIMYFIFRSIGPLLILIYLNVQLIRALNLVRRKQKEMTRRTKNRENLTAMLVYVVSVFIVCEMPDTVLRVIYTISEKSDAIDIDITGLRVANVITNTLLTVNSSVNFIIYCLIGKKFRTILSTMFCSSGGGASQREFSETEPLTMRSTVNQNCLVVTYKNGTDNKAEKSDVPADVHL